MLLSFSKAANRRNTLVASHNACGSATWPSSEVHRCSRVFENAKCKIATKWFCKNKGNATNQSFAQEHLGCLVQWSEVQRDQFPSFLPTAAHHESHERKDAVDNLLQMHIHSNTVTISTWSTHGWRWWWLFPGGKPIDDYSLTANIRPSCLYWPHCSRKLQSKIVNQSTRDLTPPPERE